MAQVNGTQNPDPQQQQSGADDANAQSQQNSGSRADTSRVADDQGGGTSDQGGGGDKKKFTFAEDRSDWVPRTRLNEESGKRTTLETQFAELKKQHEVNEKRLRIAMGVETLDPEDARAAEARDALYRLNPKLRLLDQLDESTIERLLSAASTAESTVSATWARHRDEMFSTLESEVADLLNVDKLTEAQVARLHRDFKAYGLEQGHKRERAERAQDSTYDLENDFVARYERGDQKLLKEFAKAFIDEWVTPARRQNHASEIRRNIRPVPRSGRERQAVVHELPKINYNDEDAFKGALLNARRGGEDGV